ncbi:heptahelical transmembrane protein 2-like isoform X4 [Prunus avium]|uniref:Heptahelical transmembrane protein 2-like isoform X4 n=1 Tax=Prunus avium TaxID=42229 RepID=A0A6P5T5X6_PRUAV|nr:heptahelical transmembrane protein 2-like isoform X4 [Prunus avium]
MCNHGKREESETKTTKQQKVKSVKKKMTLMKFQDLPQYMKDNEFILDYYRHLVGFLIFVGLTVMSLRDDTELGGLLGNFSRASVSGPLMTMTTMKMMDLNVSSTQNDSHLRQISQASSIIHANKENVYDAIPRWPWFVFLSGAMGCLVCSSLSHLLACHSKRFNFFFWRLDYAGISLMIVCSFFAPIYYCFSCNPYSRFFYLSSISVLGILAIITLLSPSLSAPRFRSFRATLFLSMGFSGVIPTVHALVLYWGNQHIFVALGYELAMAIFYASGAAFYVSRIPERWKPGKFDLAGHSHQIFHVFVVLGALAHSAATLVVMDFRRGSPTCGY